MAGNPFYVDPAANRGLAQGLGQIGTAYFQKQQQQQQQQDLMNRRQQTMTLLNQFNQAQDPQERQQLFLQAFQSDPEMVEGYMNELRAQSKAQLESKPDHITPYQQETIDIKKESNRLRQLEINIRNKEREAQKETNEIRKQKLQADADLAKSKAQEQAKKIETAAIKEAEGLNRTLFNVERMIGHSGLESAVGGTSIFPTIPGSDASDFETYFDTFKGQQFLNEVEKMKGLGTLTENEGNKLVAAAQSLELNMSEEAFKKELEIIKSTIKKAKSRLSGKLPKSVKEDLEMTPGENKLAPESALNYLRNNPQAIDQFEAKYGYRPEGF